LPRFRERSVRPKAPRFSNADILVAEDPDGLTYFTHEINGRLYAGWYRRRPGERLEVFTRTKTRTEFLGELSLEEQARRILAELVAEDDFSVIRDGAAPVPPRRKKR
jgi:hypothetical protein